MSKKVVAALDMSLSGAGITVLDDKGDVLHQEKLSSEKMSTKAYKGQTRLRILGVDNSVTSEEYIPSSNLLDMRRVAFFKNRIVHILQQYKVEEVVIEGYSFNSQGRSVISLGELGGVIRFAMYEMNIPYVQCPPYNAKAFITGLAWAKKDQMQAGILDKYGVWIEDDNIADSYAMARMLHEFEDKMMEYCSEGGVDKLKDLKADDIREKYKKDKLQSFIKLLSIGRVSDQDYLEIVPLIKSKSTKEKQELFVMEEKDVLGMEKKFNAKKINDKYKLKKPKKAGKAKDSEQE